MYIHVYTYICTSQTHKHHHYINYHISTFHTVLRATLAQLQQCNDYVVCVCVLPGRREKAAADESGRQARAALQTGNDGTRSGQTLVLSLRHLEVSQD